MKTIVSFLWLCLLRIFLCTTNFIKKIFFISIHIKKLKRWVFQNINILCFIKCLSCKKLLLAKPYYSTNTRQSFMFSHRLLEHHQVQIYEKPKCIFFRYVYYCHVLGKIIKIYCCQKNCLKLRVLYRLIEGSNYLKTFVVKIIIWCHS